MIIFNQPYQIDHIKILGEYVDKPTCVTEQKRAVKNLEEKKYKPVSFGCVEIRKGTDNEMGTSKKRYM